VPSRFRASTFRKIVAVAAIVAAAAAGATVVGPALASSTHRGTSHPVVRPPVGGVPLIAPTAARGRLSPAAAGKAVSTCVFYAARAGWPNNGYFGGDLVTAATICVAESRGDPHLKVCDDGMGNITGQGDWPTFQCPAGSVSYDRGLWQLNSVHAKAITDKCAFDPVCNAGQAYLHSGRGISFAPWSSYDQQTYAGPFLDLVQAAVTKQTHGTITSAVLGECLAQSRPVAGAKVDVANCGSGAASQQWLTSGGKLRSGSRCAAIGSSGRNPGVVLRRCAKTKMQEWAVFGRFELRNAADHKCLTDPDSSLKAGTQVDVTTCANAKNQTWWLP
jgi:Ricin-type beta-trefoil lectin domain/Lysozyme like domain